MTIYYDFIITLKVQNRLKNTTLSLAKTLIFINLPFNSIIL